MHPADQSAEVTGFLPLGILLDSFNGPPRRHRQPKPRRRSQVDGLSSRFCKTGRSNFRKFYTSVQEFTANGIRALPYVGSTTIIDMSDSVVGEWTVNANGSVDVNSYREVL